MSPTTRPFPAQLDDLNVTLPRISPKPKHRRLCSQLPGYRKWGREVRGLMTDQCTGDNTTPSIDPCRTPMNRHIRSNQPPESPLPPRSSAAPHGPCCIARCPDVDKRELTRRAKIFPGPAHKFPPFQKSHHTGRCFDFSGLVAMACIGPADLDPFCNHF